MLEILNLCDQHAGVAYETSSWLKNNLELSVSKCLQHWVQIVADARNIFVLVANAQATAKIDVVQVNSSGGELVDEFQKLVESLAKR